MATMSIQMGAERKLPENWIHGMSTELKEKKLYKDGLLIILKGIGNECCQGIVENETHKAFENNYKDWNLFCTEELGLDGYWELNDISHLTGLDLNNVTIVIIFDGEINFEGSYWDFQNKFWEGDDIETNKNVSSSYGKWIEKENDKTLVTIKTSEFFTIEKNVSAENYDINKLGFVIASTDEMGYGNDYGDFIMGIIYDNEEYELEYPGGVGDCDLLYFE